MSKLTLDHYGKGKIAPQRPSPPDGAPTVAVASADYEGLGHVAETYWLSPASDGQPAYELWFSIDGLPNKIFCCGRLEPELSAKAEEAAAVLLESLWHGRYEPAVRLSGFKESGLLAKEQLDRIHADYMERLKSPKAPEGGPVVQGELFYRDGTLKYRGEICGNLPHGRGIGYWENRAVWCAGEFRDGSPHGLCVLHRDNGVHLYEGHLVKGFPCGQGREYRMDGKLWFDGIFGDSPSIYQGYGCRNWVRGRLYDDNGNLVHDGAFKFDGKNSSPVS